MSIGGSASVFHVKDLCEQKISVTAIYFKNSTELAVHGYTVAEKLEKPT